MQASVQVDGQQSRWFRVDEGLRQGCPLSWRNENIGVKVSGVWCGALLYADDIVQTAESGCKRCWICRKRKRKRTCSGEKWKIGDEEMEEVESFKYLGVWFD